MAHLLAQIPRLFTYYTVLLLGQALLTTLGLAVIGCGLGFVIGFAVVYLRQTPGRFWWPLRLLAIVYVEVFRRIPFLVILYLVLFFIQAVVPGASLFTIAVIGICLLSVAYLSEIIRGGLESVPRQQVEAATVMNFSRWRRTWYVVLPQAWPVVLPPALAFMVGFIKDTALVSQIGVLELTSVGKILNNRGFSALLVFGTILALYFALSYPLSRLGARLEARLAPSRNPRHRRRLRTAASPA